MQHSEYVPLLPKSSLLNGSFTCAAGGGGSVCSCRTHARVSHHWRQPGRAGVLHYFGVLHGPDPQRKVYCLLKNGRGATERGSGVPAVSDQPAVAAVTYLLCHAGHHWGGCPGYVPDARRYTSRICAGATCLRQSTVAGDKGISGHGQRRYGGAGLGQFHDPRPRHPRPGFHP